MSDVQRSWLVLGGKPLPGFPPRIPLSWLGHRFSPEADRFSSKKRADSLGRVSHSPQHPPLSRGRGFTLIELMLVVIILGVLIAMAVPRLAGRSEQARRAAASADIHSNIAVALDLYELDIGKYPEGLSALLEKPAQVSMWRGPYLKKEPIDPWGRPYFYKAPGEQRPNDYDLASWGADGVQRGGDDVTNWDKPTS